MKATLEFNLPEDREEYEIHTNAMNAHSRLWDLDSSIRVLMKNAEDDATHDMLSPLLEIVADALPDM